jgi:hypothetical protein
MEVGDFVMSCNTKGRTTLNMLDPNRRALASCLLLCLLLLSLLLILLHGVTKSDDEVLDVWIR